MSKRSIKRLGMLLCTLLLAFIVGCQPVGGLNLNEMVTKQIDVTHQEQSQLLEIDIAFNEEAIPTDEPELTAMVEAFKKFSLNITHSKADDKGNLWLTGEFAFGKGVIPFTLQANETVFRLDLGGVSRPLIIQMDESMEQSLGLLLPAFSASTGDNSQQELMKIVRKLLHTVAPYFVNGLPNPPTVSVSQETVTINKVSTSLNKIHAELNGEQLGELISVYVSNLIKDEEGFRAMLTNVIQWFEELPPELLEQFGGNDMFGEDFDAEALVEEGVTELFPMLQEAQKELESAREGEEWKEIFDKGITLVADIYVDSSLQLRKTDVKLVIEPEAFTREGSPVRKITVRTSGELWNVNGAVEFPVIDIPRNALNLEDMMGMQPYQMLEMVDKQSALYDILKNDMQIDDQSFVISTEWGVPFYRNDKGDSFVPLRSTLMGFGVNTYYTPATKMITFYDDATKQTVDLQVNSAKALVNGKEVLLAHKVIDDGHAVYVAADDLFLILGATYQLSEFDDDELMMNVTRDL